MTTEKFKSIRKKHGLTLKSLAELFTVHPATVEGWENGRHRISGAVAFSMNLINKKKVMVLTEDEWKIIMRGITHNSNHKKRALLLLGLKMEYYKGIT